MKLVKYVAFAGDILYILWILYNGVDEGFRDIGSVQSIALLGLILLLIINLILLGKQKSF